MSIRNEIMSTFKRVAEEQRRELAPLTDDLNLMECGLGSLGFALVVVSLEESVKIDPFLDTENFPVTLRDFIALYEQNESGMGTGH